LGHTDHLRANIVPLAPKRYSCCVPLSQLDFKSHTISRLRLSHERTADKWYFIGYIHRHKEDLSSVSASGGTA
jgi:hypothetical protein